MSLIRRTLTPRARAANRSNALRSTGPRSLRGKRQSRLNAVQNGTRSALLKEYSNLWLATVVAPPPVQYPCLNFDAMPVPITPVAGRNTALREYARAAIFAAAPYVRAQAIRKGGGGAALARARNQ